MMLRIRYVNFGWFLLAVAGISCGTGSPSSPQTANPAADNLPTTTEPQGDGRTAADEGSSIAQDTPKRGPRRRVVAPVEVKSTPASQATQTSSNAEQLEIERAALKPFQILLGSWKGLSRKALSDQPNWAYDWVSDPKHPGLRIVSDTGAYIRDGRLTYLPESEQFELTATDAEGSRRTFRGTFLEPIRDVATDDKKLQRTYKLQLTETQASPSDVQWRLTFNQQENNRYILEVDRKRGNGPFTRVDTIHTQREGTSFALSETDYGDKTCIISQGLGTISVSYKGQSFWVCCSGCKAAFEDDPEKWIAKWEAKKTK